MNEFMYGPQPIPQPMYGRGATSVGGSIGWIYVNGIDGARNQIVAPGQTAWMMDNNEPIFYVKSVSHIGQPTIEAFRFEKITDGIRAAQGPDKMATLEDLEKLSARMDQISGRVDKLIGEFGGLNT